MIRKASKEGGTDMLKAVKTLVHRITNHLQLISGYLEMANYAKALSDFIETSRNAKISGTPVIVNDVNKPYRDCTQIQ